MILNRHYSEKPMHRPAGSLLHLGAIALISALSACARPVPEGDVHSGHTMTPPASATTGSVRSETTLPAGASDAADRLARSPRHAEWAMVRTGPSDSVRAWVVYPERSTKAPVV